MGIIGSPYQRTIAEMDVGEEGYTIPWALNFDLNDVPYLYTGMPVSEKPGGTVEMLIKRIGPCPADYIIDIQNVEYKWQRCETPFGGVIDLSTSHIVRLEHNASELPSLEEEDVGDIVSDVESWLKSET